MSRHPVSTPVAGLARTCRVALPLGQCFSELPDVRFEPNRGLRQPMASTSIGVVIRQRGWFRPLLDLENLGAFPAERSTWFLFSRQVPFGRVSWSVADRSNTS